MHSGSGWAAAGPSSDADFVSGLGVDFDNCSDVGRRSSSKTSSLKSEAVNWVGVRGGDGTYSSGSVMIARSRGSVKVVEKGEGGSGSKAGTLAAGSELEKGPYSSWEEQETHGSGELDLRCAKGLPNESSSRARLEGTNRRIRPSCITHVKYLALSHGKPRVFDSRFVCEPMGSVASGQVSDDGSGENGRCCLIRTVVVERCC